VLNGETVIYVGNLYEKKIAGSTTTHTKYYYFGGRRIALRVAGTLYWLLSDQRVALRVNGLLRWLAADHLGSTSITASDSGARMAELRYRPWGETSYSWGATPTQRRFTGQTLDGVAGGLYFYNARYYDPSLGRFTQADTIVPNPANQAGLNRYTYSANNPTIYVDPKSPAQAGAGSAEHGVQAERSQRCDRRRQPGYVPQSPQSVKTLNAKSQLLIDKNYCVDIQPRKRQAALARAARKRSQNTRHTEKA